MAIITPVLLDLPYMECPVYAHKWAAFVPRTFDASAENHLNRWIDIEILCRFYKPSSIPVEDVQGSQAVIDGKPAYVFIIDGVVWVPEYRQTPWKELLKASDDIFVSEGVSEFDYFTAYFQNPIVLQDFITALMQQKISEARFKPYPQVPQE
jgi:hypothetical protein